METVDVVVIGGGVIGCAIARALLSVLPSLRVCLIEKESELARHQSGRNSGVVHVGYNQKPGTLKAKFVVEGSRRIRQYCKDKAVPCIEDGIIVVARNDAEVETVHELHRRGTENGAHVDVIGPSDISRLEPHVKGMAALYAPEGASFDSRRYVLALAQDATSLGATLLLGQSVMALAEGGNRVIVSTDKQTLQARLLINAAGLHADRFAHMLGCGRGYQIVPFKGEYYELVPERRFLVRSHVYPAPDLNFPFLGVHFSRTVDGKIIVGPGALLAGGREAYSRFQVNARDLISMTSFQGFWKMLCSKDLQATIAREWKKSLLKSAVVEEGRQMLPDLEEADLERGSCGIRAQLVSADGKLVDDLAVEETDQSLHILNAVSPALTCSLPFADHVVALAEKKL
jgi:L-2-hydroxyglutarate oxidase